jgi:hypothetical protein
VRVCAAGKCILRSNCLTRVAWQAVAIPLFVLVRFVLALCGLRGTRFRLPTLVFGPKMIGFVDGVSRWSKPRSVQASPADQNLFDQAGTLSLECAQQRLQFPKTIVPPASQTFACRSLQASRPPPNRAATAQKTVSALLLYAGYHHLCNRRWPGQTLGKPQSSRFQTTEPLFRA